MREQPTGRRFKLDMLVNNGEDVDLTISSLLKDQFKAIGIDLNIRVLDAAAGAGGEAWLKRTFQLSMSSGIVTGPTPDVMGEQWLSRFGGSNATDPWMDPGGINDTRVDYIIDHDGGVNATEFKALMKELQITFAKNVYQIGVFDWAILIAWRSDYRGLPQPSFGHYDSYATVWWTKGTASMTTSTEMTTTTAVSGVSPGILIGAVAVIIIVAATLLIRSRRKRTS